MVTFFILCVPDVVERSCAALFEDFLREESSAALDLPSVLVWL